MDVSQHRVIKADQARVLAYVTDLRNDTEWRKLITGSTLIDGEPNVVGARYEQTMNMMGRVSTTTATLASIDGNCYAYDGQGMMPARFTVAAEPHPEGTEVTLFFSAEVPPPMVKMATKGIAADMNADLAKLATLMES
jgi:carbon monoxide dehydrogenase subunit G